jgi:hypothetical protein
MKINRRKARRFLKMLKATALQLAAYVLFMYLIVLAVCIIVGLPEIIGAMIFGF